MRKRKIFLTCLIGIGIAGLAAGCSTMKGAHKITPVSQNRIIIEHGKTVSVEVDSAIALMTEIEQFKRYLAAALKNKGFLKIADAGANPDFKIRVNITKVKRVDWLERWFLGELITGRGAVTATVEVNDRSEFVIFAKAPVPTFGLGAAGLGVTKENGTTRMALEECAKRIADYLTQPGGV